jgi:hypothetical protein
MQKSSDMVHHHLLQLISRSISVGCYPSDLSHSATRGTTVVFFHLELSRSGSRTVLRISYRDGRPKSHLSLNDAGIGTNRLEPQRGRERREKSAPWHGISVRIAQMTNKPGDYAPKEPFRHPLHEVRARVRLR